MKKKNPNFSPRRAGKQPGTQEEGRLWPRMGQRAGVVGVLVKVVLSQELDPQLISSGPEGATGSDRETSVCTRHTQAHPELSLFPCMNYFVLHCCPFFSLPLPFIFSFLTPSFLHLLLRPFLGPLTVPLFPLSYIYTNSP